MSPGELEIRYALEARKTRRDKLAVVLETTGGYMETAERMANVFRSNYAQLDFIIPNYAFSAGTVLAMAGDAIHMDYFSVLGPIDPQAERGEFNLVPALGYLEQFERLIRESHQRRLTGAELAYLLNFDAAELYRYEQERELSIALLQEWLVKYKFKEWTKTETRGKTVTAAMRKRRATEVGRALNDPKRWHSHSRGISMEVLRRDLRLLIDDFGSHAQLRTYVPEFYRLLKDYMVKRGHTWIVYTPNRYSPII